MSCLLCHSALSDKATFTLVTTQVVAPSSLSIPRSPVMPIPFQRIAVNCTTTTRSCKVLLHSTIRGTANLAKSESDKNGDSHTLR